MQTVNGLGEILIQSLSNLWQRIVDFLPSFFGAILIFLLGIMIASVVGKLIEKIVKASRIDRAMERVNANSKLKVLGIETNFSSFIGKLVQWFVVLVFLMVSTDILGLKEVTAFLNSIVLYIPNVVVATIIMTVAFLLGGIAYSVVRGSTRAAGVMSASLLATMVKWAIIIFGLLAALVQLGIASSLVNTLFIGFVSALSLALGLSFGLGGKEEAALILKKIREDISEK